MRRDLGERDAADHRIRLGEQPTDPLDRHRREAVALAFHRPLLGDRLERDGRGAIRTRFFSSAGSIAVGDQFLRLVSHGGRQRGHPAKVKRLLPIEKTLSEAPQRPTVGLHLEWQPLRIAQGPSLFSRLGGIELNRGQYGRLPSKAGSIREQQKRQHFVVAAVALSRISPDGVWRFSV